MLELFCGTKSVSKAVGNQFEEVINVDLDSSFNPTHCVNILEWDYKIYPREHFHTIWASPPCQEFSCLNFARPEKIPNLPLADSIVQKVIEIIEYFNPNRWFIENPQSGCLKDRPYMLGIPFIDMDYCQFSNWGYRKRTRFWTSVDGNSILCNKKDCVNMINGRHKSAIGNCGYKQYKPENVKALHQRYAIPPMLIEKLFGFTH